MASGNSTRLGILVGGGPAPGINSAISAVAIEAINSGSEVIGILDGFEHVSKGHTDMVLPLAINDVSRIHAQGGSILRTSRANPTRDPEDLRRTVQAFDELGITRLVTIGGDDTAFGAYGVAKAADGRIRVGHVPKTIDNDLPLPSGMPTFGYETARHLGTQLVLNLEEDSRMTNRWIFVVVMGRKAGHLALGIGKSAGATLTVIPEAFRPGQISLADVYAVLEGSMLKRRAMGRRDGLAVIAEGIAENMDPTELHEIPGVEIRSDPYGNLRLGEIPLATILKRGVQNRFAERGESISIVDVTLGYELRCAPPIPFDIDYTRTLGYGAARFLHEEQSDERLKLGGLVCMEGARLQVIPFEDLVDPATNRTRVRTVDVLSEHYKVAAEYMVRLEREDLTDPEKLSGLANAGGMSNDEFTAMFASVV